MREIKFRAFCNGKMHEVKNICLYGASTVTIQYNPLIKKRIEEVNLMQFAGLLDKNGKEIYEGDVLDVKLYDWSRADSVIARENVVMQFSDGCFGFEWGVRKEFTRVKDFSLATFEIIGNIHENPDRMEKQPCG